MQGALFSEQVVNVGRQREFDLLKAVMIFLLIACHVREVFFSHVWEDFAFCNLSLGWQIYQIVGNCVVAFAYMFSMGVMIPFSRNQDAGLWIRRGFKLILAWFVLKLIIAYPLTALFADVVKLPAEEFFIGVCVSNDILFFAGTYFIFLGALRKVGLGTLGTVCVALGAFVLGHFVSWHGGSLIAQQFAGNFIETNESVFPFLNWIMAPTLGFLWGQMLRRCANKDRLYLLTGGIGALGTSALSLYAWHRGYLSAESIADHSSVQVFYDANVLTVAVACLLLAVVASLCHFITRIADYRPFVAVYSTLSNRLTVLYFCQWIIIPWAALAAPRPTSQVSPWWGTLVALLVLAVSLAISKIWKDLRLNAK